MGTVHDGHEVQSPVSGPCTRVPQRDMTKLREVMGKLRVIERPQKVAAGPWRSKAQTGAQKLGCEVIP